MSGAGGLGMGVRGLPGSIPATLGRKLLRRLGERRLRAPLEAVTTVALSYSRVTHASLLDPGQDQPLGAGAGHQEQDRGPSTEPDLPEFGP